MGDSERFAGRARRAGRPTPARRGAEERPTVATLEIRGLRKTFGGVVALAGVDMTVRSEEILGVIGPNGSGKTTLFNTVCGVYRPNGGTIHWNGVDIAGRPAYTIGRLASGAPSSRRCRFLRLPCGRTCRSRSSTARDGKTAQGRNGRRRRSFWSSSAWRGSLTKSRTPCRSAICGASGWRWRSAGARRNSCLTSRRRDSTKEKASNSFICFGAPMNLELGFASSITMLA